MAHADAAAWQERLRAEVPKSDIPRFLTDLQALVAAMRAGHPWEERLTPALRDHPGLVLSYVRGDARQALAVALQDEGADVDATSEDTGDAADDERPTHSATGDVGASTDRGQRAQGE